MPTFICQSAELSNGIKRILLSRDSGSQPEYIFLNVTSETFPEAFMEGDELSIEFRLIRRPGTNGP